MFLSYDLDHVFIGELETYKMRMGYFEGEAKLCREEYLIDAVIVGTSKKGPKIVLFNSLKHILMIRKS